MEIHRLIITPITKNSKNYIRYNPDEPAAARLLKERIEIKSRESSTKPPLPLSTKKFLRKLKDFGINLDTMVIK